MSETEKAVEHKKFDMLVKYQSVFGSDDGQIILKDLMASCHFLRTTLSDSPYETHFKEGQRAVIIRILETLKVDPTQMLTILEMGNQQGEHNALD